MKEYFNWTITKNEECKDYPWNIYDENGEYICSCSTLEEASRITGAVFNLRGNRYDEF